MNPKSLKKYTLIKIFRQTESKENINGCLVLCLAKEKLEKTFIKEKAGNPKAK